MANPAGAAWLSARRRVGRAHGRRHPGRSAIPRRRPRHRHAQRHGRHALLELYLVYGELEQHLRGRQIAIARRLVGNYITSLDMAGCSITLLQADDELLSLWDDPVLTPALRWGI